jgi:hypothetical protein
MIRHVEAFYTQISYGFTAGKNADSELIIAYYSIYFVRNI